MKTHARTSAAAPKKPTEAIADDLFELRRAQRARDLARIETLSAPSPALAKCGLLIDRAERQFSYALSVANAVPQVTSVSRDDPKKFALAVRNLQIVNDDAVRAAMGRLNDARALLATARNDDTERIAELQRLSRNLRSTAVR